jgi:hypothetical protein
MTAKERDAIIAAVDDMYTRLDAILDLVVVAKEPAPTRSKPKKKAGKKA